MDFTVLGSATCTVNGNLPNRAIITSYHKPESSNKSRQTMQPRGTRKQMCRQQLTLVLSLPTPSSYILLGPKYPLLGIIIYPQSRVQGRSWLFCFHSYCLSLESLVGSYTYVGSSNPFRADCCALDASDFHFTRRFSEDISQPLRSVNAILVSKAYGSITLL